LLEVPESRVFALKTVAGLVNEVESRGAVALEGGGVEDSAGVAADASPIVGVPDARSEAANTVVSGVGVVQSWRADTSLLECIIDVGGRA
jgi:hypothetical protein